MAETIRVRVLQLGRRVVDHAAAPEATLSTVLESVGMKGIDGMDIRVNGAAAELSAVLRDGDTVTVIPRIKGGQR